MALTAKPISTISYNTEQFIERKLEQMFKANIITDYRWIKHMGEDGDKDHVHMLLYPNKRIDTAELREEFNEIPIGSAEDKPLGCLPFRTSKTDHWLMYVLHDPEYLKNHKSDDDGDGKIPYEINEIKTPFPEQLARDIKKALQLRKTQNQEVLDRIIKQHQSPTTIMYETGINPMVVASIMNAYLREASMLYAREEQEQKIKQIEEAVKITGSVEVREELPQLKAEYEKGIISEKVEAYHMDFATGETVKDYQGIEQKKEEEAEDGNIWEGIEQK